MRKMLESLRDCFLAAILIVPVVLVILSAYAVYGAISDHFNHKGVSVITIKPSIIQAPVSTVAK